MKKLPIWALLLFIAAFLSPSTNAQELKIGYVDPQSILSRMPEIKAVQQRIANFTERKSTELQTKQMEFQNAIEVYRQKESAISESAKRTEQEKLQQMNEDLIRAEQQAQAEIADRRNELLGPLLEQIDAAISTVAKRLDLAYVLNTTTNNGDLIILYASPDYQGKYDITRQVMDELGM